MLIPTPGKSPVKTGPKGSDPVLRLVVRCSSEDGGVFASSDGHSAAMAAEREAALRRRGVRG